MGDGSVNLLKYVGSLIFCNIYRLLRIFPNNDPVMGCMLPFARQGKWWQALLFPLIAMVSFDFLSGRVGIWTIGTAATYAGLGLFFHLRFRNVKKMSLGKYAKNSVLGVLIFDFFTGPIMSSFVFGMPFIVSFAGQIPFTLMHLASASVLTVLIAPVLDVQVRYSMQETYARYLNRLKLAMAWKVE